MQWNRLLLGDIQIIEYRRYLVCQDELPCQQYNIIAMTNLSGVHNNKKIRKLVTSSFNEITF